MSSLLAADRFSDSISDDPYWNESVWFSIAKPDESINGISQYYFCPNLGMLNGSPILSDPDHNFFWNCLYHNWTHLQPIPPSAEKFDMTAYNSLSVKVLEPLTRYAITTPNDLVDPYEPCEWLNGPEIPRLLFNPAPPGDGQSLLGRLAGTWVVTHYEDINRVYTDNAHFSNKGTAEFQALIGETFRSIPLAIDPPEHGKYRRFLAPHFSPARLNGMEAQIRELVGGAPGAAGPAHPARRMVQAHSRIRVKPGADTTVFPGLLSIRNLPLVWDPGQRPSAA